jgi:hypothetical protein
MAWGGAEEQAKEIAAGNHNAKNWHDEALKTTELTMQDYWQEIEDAHTVRQGTTEFDVDTHMRDDMLESEFNRHRRSLIEKAGHGATLGWTAELQRYLADLPEDVMKNMNIVDWWSKHATIYPTLARIAQDICAIPASSVPCECLFSAGAEIATDCRSCLGAEKFEELQILQCMWRRSIVDRAAFNSNEVADIYLQEYKELYKLDKELTMTEVDLTGSDTKE